MKSLVMALSMITLIVSVSWNFGVNELNGEAVPSQVSQEAIDSGAIPIEMSLMSGMLMDIEALCVSYGFEEVRNHDTERLIGSQERRSVFDRTFMKRTLTAIWFTNGVSADSVTFHLFGEPFSKDEYSSFRTSFLQIANKYRRDNEEISYSKKDGRVVYGNRQPRGSHER
jgi:hypothetical protein